jgi:hypothetical protein
MGDLVEGCGAVRISDGLPDEFDYDTKIEDLIIVSYPT